MRIGPVIIRFRARIMALIGAGAVVVLPPALVRAASATRPVGGQGGATGQWAFVVGYVVVWGVLLGYLAYLGGRNRKADRRIARLEQLAERHKDPGPTE